MNFQMDYSKIPVGEEIVHTVIVGGGQAGLAVSRCLMDFDLTRENHVILERGQIGERWRSSYWNSLHLLTPKWQTRLPGGYSYQGQDKEEFMSAGEFVDYLEAYAQSFQAPIKTNTTVVAIDESNDNGSRFKVIANNGSVWFTRNVVIATGYCDLPRIPSFASQLPDFVKQIPVAEYKNPSQVVQENDDSARKQIILVVGAGASGIQIAEELAEATKENKDIQIIISVGRHCRWPRSYRGKDILWWMEELGVFQSPANQHEESSSPGPQLKGSKDHADVSLYELWQKGVEIVGRVTKMTKEQVDFDSNDLGSTLKQADDSCVQLLRMIDEFAANHGLNPSNTPSLDVEPIQHEELCPRLAYSMPSRKCLDLRDPNAVSVSVIWATGFYRQCPFLCESLKQRVWDEERRILRNDGGVVIEKPGLYVLGYRWLKRKGSNFVDGVGRDALDIAQQISSS